MSTIFFLGGEGGVTGFGSVIVSVSTLYANGLDVWHILLALRKHVHAIYSDFSRQ